MLSFLVPHLPQSVITSNRRDERNPDGKGRNEEQGKLQGEVVNAIQNKWGANVPVLEKASIAIHYRQLQRHPKDGRYRVKTAVWELAGSITAAVCKGCIDAGVVTNRGIIYYSGGVELVDNPDLEGIFVAIQELA